MQDVPAGTSCAFQGWTAGITPVHTGWLAFGYEVQTLKQLENGTSFCCPRVLGDCKDKAQVSPFFHAQNADDISFWSGNQRLCNRSSSEHEHLQSNAVCHAFALQCAFSHESAVLPILCHCLLQKVLEAKAQKAQCFSNYLLSNLGMWNQRLCLC